MRERREVKEDAEVGGAGRAGGGGGAPDMTGTTASLCADNVTVDGRARMSLHIEEPKK